MTFIVDNIKACEPINTLLRVLQDKRFEIIESKVGDYHFNELYFSLKANRQNIQLDDIDIFNIGRYSAHTFYCKCHWSLVEISV